MSENSFHPGIFLQELLVWQKLEPAELAAKTGIPEMEILGITEQRRGIDEAISEDLAEYFGNSARFWMNLQKSYDRRTA